MDKIQYICPKCGCRDFESDRMQTTGGNLSRVFDIQNKRFTTISCKQCGYTELYKTKSSTGMDILDLLFGG